MIEFRVGRIARTVRPTLIELQNKKPLHVLNKFINSFLNEGIARKRFSFKKPDVLSLMSASCFSPHLPSKLYKPLCSLSKHSKRKLHTTIS